MTSPASQEYCLKWNNHRTTILSVMDTLLEEESLVDVTLSTDGQFIRAHRVILSACSPYFRTLFKSTFLNDKHPVIVLKDVDFDNLKCLVEYMYKGEANVPQHMLSSFIQTAESLQIRGLAEGASKQKLEQVAELNQAASVSAAGSSPVAAAATATATGGPHLNIPSIPITPQINNASHFKQEPANGKKGMDPISGGILAARLAKMVDNPPMQMFDFHEQLAMAARQASALVPPPMKKPRKVPATVSLPGVPVTSSPIKSPDINGSLTAVSAGGTVINTKAELSIKKDLLAKNSRMSPKSTNIMAPSPLTAPNNNYESDSDVLKIDEDRDNGKENKENSEGKDDDITEMDTKENGIDSEEEAMSNKELAERAVGFINPWTGEEIPGIAQDDDDSLTGVGPVFPSMDSSLPSLTRLDISGADERASSAAALTADNNRDPLTNKYSCSRCGRSYLHQATLVRHQRYECGISASYPCQLCGRKFKRRDVLKGHMEKCMNKSNLTPANSPMLTSSSPLLTSTSPLRASSSPLAPPAAQPITSMSPYSGVMQ